PKKCDLTEVGTGAQSCHGSTIPSDLHLAVGDDVETVARLTFTHDDGSGGHFDMPKTRGDGFDHRVRKWREEVHRSEDGTLLLRDPERSSPGPDPGAGGQ